MTNARILDLIKKYWDMCPEGTQFAQLLGNIFYFNPFNIKDDLLETILTFCINSNTIFPSKKQLEETIKIHNNYMLPTAKRWNKNLKKRIQAKIKTNKTK